jgi:hypothetical protein
MPRSFVKENSSSHRGREIVPRSDLERQSFAMMKNLASEHTCVFYEELLVKTSMHSEFGSVFRIVVWSDFWEISELGSKLLTLEFLITLVVTDTGINFDMFYEEFFCTWCMLGNTLGFNKQCSLYAHECLPNFDRKISRKGFLGKKVVEPPGTNDIHNPTLRFLHHWLAITLHPWAEHG